MQIEKTDSFRDPSERRQTTGENRNDSASRSIKFDVLNMMERGLGVEEVNAVDAVQEIVEITIDSGAAKSAWADPREGCWEDKKVTKTERRPEMGIRTEV